MINSYKFLFLFMIAIGLESLNLQALQAQSIFPDKNLEKVVRRYVFAKRNNEESLSVDDVENISI